MKISNLVLSLFLNDRTDAKCLNHCAFTALGGNDARPPIAPSLYNPSETETVVIEIPPQGTAYLESLFLQDDPARGGIEGVKAKRTAKTFTLTVPVQNAGKDSRPFLKTSVKNAGEYAEFLAWKASQTA